MSVKNSSEIYYPKDYCTKKNAVGGFKYFLEKCTGGSVGWKDNPGKKLSFATKHKLDGTPTAFISEFLGHSNQKTTEGYMKSLLSETMKHANTT